MDIEIPGIDGIEVTQKLAEICPETKVIILTSCTQQTYIDRAFEAGAKGYLQKNSTALKLARAIRFVNRHYLQCGQGLFLPLDSSHQQPQLPESTDTSTKIVPQNTPELSSTSALSIVSSEEDWSMATKDLLDALPRLWTRGLFYVSIVFTAVLLPWSILAKVDETGMARGKLEPQAKTVKLDAPVAGTVAAIKVEEGDTVQAQQVLLELESDTLRAELQQLQAQNTGQQERLGQLKLIKSQLSVALNTQKQQNQAQNLEKQAQIAQARQNLRGIEALSKVQTVEKQAQIEQYERALDVSNANHRLATLALKGAVNKASRYSCNDPK